MRVEPEAADFVSPLRVLEQIQSLVDEPRGRSIPAVVSDKDNRFCHHGTFLRRMAHGEIAVAGNPLRKHRRERGSIVLRGFIASVILASPLVIYPLTGYGT